MSEVLVSPPTPIGVSARFSPSGARFALPGFCMSEFFFLVLHSPRCFFFLLAAETAVAIFPGVFTGHDRVGSGGNRHLAGRVGSGRARRSSQNLARGVGVGLGDPTRPDPTCELRPDPWKAQHFSTFVAWRSVLFLNPS